MAVKKETALATAILAEKPSVARDIARVVGASKQGEGYLHGGGYIVTWGVGHLVGLAQPHEIRPEWRAWRKDLLPMLPSEWPLVVYDQTRDQFEVVSKILNSPKVGKVVCATDAGREGELIFRYIYEAAECNKPVDRLWVSSLTPEAIRKALDKMRPGEEYDPLADAARGRSRADWLVGMNLSRAYTLALGEDFSVGRVQTPTLAMLVDRELEIRAFVPEDYIEVVAEFSPRAGESYKGLWFREGVEPLQKAQRLPADGVEAEAIVARAKSGQAAIESIRAETQRSAPPPLYDLTELQRHANRLYGFSAQRTLETAQALYEKHKLLSYPRTDSRHLSADVARTLPAVVASIREPYEAQLAEGTGERPLGKRFVDDAKVTDHHAIIPTTTRAGRAKLSQDEERIYDMVCRRLLSAWHADHIWAVTTVITAIRNGALRDLYRSTGTAVKQVGWKALDIVVEKKRKGGEDDESEAQSLPSSLAEGQPQKVLDAKALRKKTRPPKRFTEATLLTAMETAGKTLDDKELSDAMKECGLGTPATRAAIIEVLLKRGYIERQGKTLVATDKGIRLIEVVHVEVKSPAMTGQWEARLNRIRRGEGELPPFLEEIEEYVRQVTGKVVRITPKPAPAAAPAPVAPIASSGDVLADALRNRFGFSEFRQSQEEVCRAVLNGEDVLLVMPTGSGKSLCYQLPGVARGGTTLVVSPLIALMEDQVAKLRASGFRAERIHSGRDRGSSREVSIAYLKGELDFLYIAPERLRVPGFPEMLAKRKPTLIAIDEAHCISQWGHDFRPDYRMIGQYLPILRPAPVIALTATATPIVQDDIGRQLGLGQTSRFIQGFRRANIAIEVVEAAPSRREELVREVLQDASRRPAIVYTPTRRDAETYAELLRRDFAVEAYHAGLEAKRRDDVQTRFLDGSLDVIVATIAFGMGVDKPDIRTVIHTALPGSMEGYYQEIGRAGRDGKPSRAVLIQAYSDRRTHDFFFDRDYPDPSVLDRIWKHLDDEPLPKLIVGKKAGLYAEELDIALEKLWIHGGVEIDAEENLKCGSKGWRESYIEQREQKSAQLDLMIRYAECNECRMVSLVRHFGDLKDSRTRCGLCDFCAPDDCVAQTFRRATKYEIDVARKAVEILRPLDALATGTLHAKLGGEAQIGRSELEGLLGGLARSGFLRIIEASFEKDGRRIAFRKAGLTDEGRALHPDEPLAFTFTETLTSKAKGRKKKAKAEPEAKSKPAAKPKRKAKTEEPAEDPVIGALRAWRLSEAKKQGVPAFRILSDRTLAEIAEQRPETVAELLGIHGIGLRIAERYGAVIFRILHERR